MSTRITKALNEPPELFLKEIWGEADEGGAPSEKH